MAESVEPHSSCTISYLIIYETVRQHRNVPASENSEGH